MVRNLVKLLRADIDRKLYKLILSLEEEDIITELSLDIEEISFVIDYPKQIEHLSQVEIIDLLKEISSSKDSSCNRMASVENKSIIQRINRPTELFEKYKEFGFDINEIKSQPDFSSRRFAREMEMIDKSISDLDVSKFFKEVLGVNFSETKLPKKIVSKILRYRNSIENDISELMFDFKWNGNNIKLIEKGDFEQVTRYVIFNEANIVESSIFSKYGINLPSETLIIMGNRFNFESKLRKKDVITLIVKVLFKESEIINYDIKEVFYKMSEIFLEITGDKQSVRAMESNVFRYELLLSLSSGKYKVTIDDDFDLVKSKSMLANEILILTNNYFEDKTNHVIDFIYFVDKIKCRSYDYYNEHELYFIAKKYSLEFSEKYASYRPPLVFKSSDSTGGKDITKIIYKHLCNFIIRNNINDVWIEKVDFFDMLFNQSGIKESNINQKINDLNNMGIEIMTIDGNRYESGKIKFLVNN